MRDSDNNKEDRAYRCSLCRDTGWQLYIKEENGLTYARECTCGYLAACKLKGRLKFADIPAEFEGQSVSNFRTDFYTGTDNRELADMAKTVGLSFVAYYDKMKEMGKGLYFFSGTKGSGKTRLAVSIANDLITQHGVNAKFCTTLQLLEKIKATWGKTRNYEEENSEQKLIDDIISVPVLILDDIGVERPHDWINEKFYSILNGRMIEKKITIFTSNCCMEKLKLDERIISRIEKMAVPIEFPEESVRGKLANTENEDALSLLLGFK